MSVISTGIKVHDDACNLSEMKRQVAVAAAGNNQATVKAAEILHFRSCLSSAIANKCGIEPFVIALQSLGTGGS